MYEPVIDHKKFVTTFAETDGQRLFDSITLVQGGRGNAFLYILPPHILEKIICSQRCEQ
jgi:hypothetical protein